MEDREGDLTKGVDFLEEEWVREEEAT